MRLRLMFHHLRYFFSLVSATTHLLSSVLEQEAEVGEDWTTNPLLLTAQTELDKTALHLFREALSSNRSSR